MPEESLCNIYRFYRFLLMVIRINCDFYLCLQFLLIFSLLSCMDPSIAIKPVFQRFQSVVITSGVS